MKTSLDTETNISLCGVKNPISKMESFNGEEKHVCISGESMTCAPLSDKEIQEESHNESYPKSRRHVKTIDDTQKEETERRYSPSELQFSYSDNHVKDKVLRVQDDSQDFTTFEDSRLVEFDFDKECTEDDPPSDVDDTAKECLRIFNEFTRSKAHKGETAKQPSGKQMELDMQYYQNISGPKRRIAHTAKFDVPTSKEITSPSRGPVPPLISHTGILQAQQRAVQIMAAIKGGQAFVAATSEQKKNTFACPASQTQWKASGDSLHVDVVLSKENPTAKPNRSHIPVKSIASFPVKAKIEDKAIYECCSRRNMYVNIARNTLKKLRDQDVSGSSNNNKTTGLKKNEKKNEKRSLGLPWCRSG
ncbi:RNA exonuclease 1 homolog isoform X2 [Monodon monoceros]|uniref:RNA exonuclease 1 homolog isoform X2 n=1 Tax=Monodon monoceros TaxID=40151 RepID=UPI0010F6DCD0|nr:RNA exonuclease 1 homolog isoform X2 [Monodon monoceros]